MKKPVHPFQECNCDCQPGPHCIALMPDNRFCCVGKKAPCHKVQPEKEATK